MSHQSAPQPDPLEVLTLRTLLRLEDQQDKIHDLLKHIMNALDTLRDFASKQTAFNTRLNTAVDGLVGDVKSLNDKITELQNSSGNVSPEDQALIDSIEAQGEALAAKAEALDAATPPVVPVPTP